MLLWAGEALAAVHALNGASGKSFDTAVYKKVNRI